MPVPSTGDPTAGHQIGGALIGLSGSPNTDGPALLEPAQLALPFTRPTAAVCAHKLQIKTPDRPKWVMMQILHPSLSVYISTAASNASD